MNKEKAKEYYGWSLETNSEDRNPAFVGKPREAKTLRALSLIAGMHPAQVWANLQDGWEAPGIHSVRLLVEDWTFDGEGIAVVEEVSLKFETLPSGGVGWWQLITENADETSPYFGESSSSGSKDNWSTSGQNNHQEKQP